MSVLEATATDAPTAPTARSQLKATAREVLRDGELEMVGRMPWSSNETFLVEAHLDGERLRAVYKPLEGERPLWDFPHGLYEREVATYELSESLGWGVVPLTVARTEGPLGRGSLQQFVDADFTEHYFTLYENTALHDQLRMICALDLVANSTDRKSGHCLLGPDGRVWAVDNGLSFHTELKLRTVIWDFGGEPIPDDLIDDLRRLIEGGLPQVLEELLDIAEREALLERARHVVRSGIFPVDVTGRRHPWPLV